MRTMAKALCLTDKVLAKLLDQSQTATIFSDNSKRDDIPDVGPAIEARAYFITPTCHHSL